MYNFYAGTITIYEDADYLAAYRRSVISHIEAVLSRVNNKSNNILVSVPARFYAIKRDKIIIPFMIRVDELEQFPNAYIQSFIQRYLHSFNISVNILPFIGDDVHDEDTADFIFSRFVRDFIRENTEHPLQFNLYNDNNYDYTDNPSWHSGLDNDEDNYATDASDSVQYTYLYHPAQETNDMTMKAVAHTRKVNIL